MKKVLLTERQLALLVHYIDETQNKSEVINEGVRDVALGVLKLMGVSLTGLNAQTAENALNDVSTLKKIEKSLETPDIEELAQNLEQAGLKNPLDLIYSNANEIMNAYNTIAKKKGIGSKLIRIYSIK